MDTSGMTISASKSLSTASNRCTISAGQKHLEGHLLADNYTWRLVDECTLEEIISRVSKYRWRWVNQCTCRWYNTWTWKAILWISSHIVEGIPSGKPATVPSNLKQLVHQPHGRCQVNVQLHGLEWRSAQLPVHQSDDGKILLAQSIPNRCKDGF